MDEIVADWSGAAWSRARSCKSTQCPEVAVRGDQVAVRNSEAPGRVTVFDRDELPGLVEALTEQLG
jgi:hypothetical protein